MSLRRPSCLLLLALLPFSSCFASEETEGMARLLINPGLIAAGIDEALAEEPDSPMTQLQRFAIDELHDDDELMRRLGGTMETLVSAGDVAAFAPFHRAGGVEAFNALRDEHPTWGRERIVDELPRAQRRAFEDFRETGALDRLVATLDGPELKTTFTTYFGELYCRAARDVAPDRFGDLAADACATNQMLTSPLPDAAVGSPDAVAVLNLFNMRELMQHAMVQALAEMAGEDADLAQDLGSWMARYSTPEELVHVAGAVLDRHATPTDLARVAAFARSESGVRFTAALKGLSPEQMGNAVETMPESVLEDLLPLVQDGSLERITEAMGDPEMEAAGRDWGRRLICRVPVGELPEEFVFVRDAGLCTNADGSIEAPVVSDRAAESAKPGKD